MSIQNKVADVMLLGTCGDSIWRDPIVQAVAERGGYAHNPIVPDWTPADGEREAFQTANARVVVVAITDETPSFGSVAEVGFALAWAMSTGRPFYLYLAEHPDKETNKPRKLVKSHLARIIDAFQPNVKIVGSLDELRDAVLNAL